jgi:TPR repeat protein
MKADNEVRTIWAENLLAWTEDRSEEVLKWLQSPAEAGVPQAMKLMGDLCATGIGIEKNLVRAFEWYKKAAATGLSVAQYRLGFCYHYGIGTDCNLAMAVEYYSLSVAQGDFDAMNELSAILINGADGIEQDEVRGVELLRTAAEGGHGKAQCSLGGILLNPDLMGITYVKQDVEEGIKWLRKSADQNIGTAECILAALCLQGVGIEKNLEEARRLYERALEHGDLLDGMEDDAKEMLAKLKGSLDDSNTGINN